MAIKKLVIKTIKLYQWFISPRLPSVCRYYPTCSQYAIDALEIHGLWRGGLMAVWRILRCHPFARGGYDPVRGSQKWQSGKG